MEGKFDYWATGFDFSKKAIQVAKLHQDLISFDFFRVSIRAGLLPQSCCLDVQKEKGFTTR